MLERTVKFFEGVRLPPSLLAFARIISRKLTGVPALSTHAAFTCGVSSTTAFFKMWLLIPADLAFDLLESVHFASG